MLLVSDADGWDSRAEDVANTVAASGRTVLGIDLKAFQAGMDKTDDTCSFPVNDLEAVSQQVQKDLPFSQYRPPALAGIGAGAALAYAAITDCCPVPFWRASVLISARSIWRRVRSAPMLRPRLQPRGPADTCSGRPKRRKRLGRRRRSRDVRRT